MPPCPVADWVVAPEESDDGASEVELNDDPPNDGLNAAVELPPVPPRVCPHAVDERAAEVAMTMVQHSIRIRVLPIFDLGRSVPSGVAAGATMPLRRGSGVFLW